MPRGLPTGKSHSFLNGSERNSLATLAPDMVTFPNGSEKTEGFAALSRYACMEIRSGGLQVCLHITGHDLFHVPD